MEFINCPACGKSVVDTVSQCQCGHVFHQPPSNIGSPSISGAAKTPQYNKEQVGMNKSGFFKRLFDLSFDEFITTKIIKALYIIMILAAAVPAVTILFGGFASKSLGGVLFGIIMSSVTFLALVMIARVWLETLIVLFRIAENTGIIAAREQPSRG